MQMGISLILACLFSNSRQIPLTIARFAANVQIYSVLLQLVQAILAFKDNTYFGLSVFKLRLISIGDLYCKSIVSEGLVKGKDFDPRVRSYLGDLVVITRILNREDAIRAVMIKIL